MKEVKTIAAKICAVCGEQRETLPSIVNRWHRCTNCGTIYCGKCGRALAGKKGLFHGTRTCPRCGSRTELW